MTKTIDPWLTLSLTLSTEREATKKRKKRKHRIACGRCGCPMYLHGYLYVCSDSKCRGKHRAHPDGKPTGVPADRETAKARYEAHHAFDALWRCGKVNRQQAYTILKRVMGMTTEEAHIGRFTLDQCRFLIARLRELGDGVYEHPYNTNGFLSNVCCSVGET